MLSRITISAFLLCAFGLLPALLATGCGPAPASREGGRGEGASSEPRCGNGIQEGDEICDGDDLDGESCSSMGYSRGELVCDDDCGGYDDDDCREGPVCGDGKVEEDERCDGADFDGETCDSLGFAGGVLKCKSGCRFDTSSCGPLATCGNGEIDPGEVCDGSALDGATCTAIGLGEGALGCLADCTGFDSSACGIGENCGNGQVDPGEACDGDNLSGKSCLALGFGDGDVVCSFNCGWVDTSDCAPPPAVCGDGVIETDKGEACEPGGFNGATCEDYGKFGDGLACSSDCSQVLTDGCCEPNCGARECGVDPVCGASCGTCGDGDVCQGDICVDICADINCGPGLCVADESGEPVCACNDGFVNDGPHSCVEQPAVCEGVTCSGNGTCVEASGEPTCTCDDGYVNGSGLTCVEETANPCEGQTCSGVGTCVVSGSTAQCSCPTGYAPGPNLTCIEDNGTVPAAWTCDASYYDEASDVCDCGCGVQDPDCSAPTSDVCQYQECGTGQIPQPDANWLCMTDTTPEPDPEPTPEPDPVDVPSGWTCTASYYGDSYCDCGCGVQDSDCASASASVCQYCVDANDCTGGTGCTTIDPDNNAQCI